MLSKEDIQLLEAPLPLADHEVRAKGKNKAETKQQWLTYITQEGVIPLLNRVDPNWTWEVLDTRIGTGYVSVTGRLTINGVSRDGTGGSSPNSAGAKVNEDTEKGAETDALKRAAVKFGVGLYLRSAPMIWVDITDKSWEDEKTALAEVAKWYKREFGKVVDRGTGEVTRQSPEMPASAPKTAAPALQPVRQPQAPTGASNANGALPDWELVYTAAFEEGLVNARPHFKNLISKMRAADPPEITDGMGTVAILEAMRKHEAAKDLLKEQEAS